MSHRLALMMLLFLSSIFVGVPGVSQSYDVLGILGP